MRCGRRLRRSVAAGSRFRSHGSNGIFFAAQNMDGVCCRSLQRRGAAQGTAQLPSCTSRRLG